MQYEDSDIHSRRLREAFQASAGEFLSFDTQRQIGWGYETKQTGSKYYWEGSKRTLSSKQPRLLFQYTFEGCGEYVEGKKLWTVEPGYGFIVLLPSAHRYYLPRDSASWTFFWFIVQHPFVTGRIQALRRAEDAVQRWEAGSLALESAAELFEAACLGKLQEVWIFEKMLFSWLLETERELHDRRYPRDERQSLLDETRRLVCERLRKPFGIAELAERHQLERTTFSRKFKATTGLTPAAFVTEVRLEEALKLLRAKAKLDEIAAETGFADANHFCKVFRRRFHSSPGAYRQLISKKMSRHLQ